LWGEGGVWAVFNYVLCLPGFDAKCVNKSTGDGSGDGINQITITSISINQSSLSSSAAAANLTVARRTSSQSHDDYELDSSLQLFIHPATVGVQR